MEISLPTLANKIPTEADAYLFLEEMRWHGKPVCPHCGSIDKHYFLTPRNGVRRETSAGNQTERRLWKCSACRRRFSVTTGTVMHNTKIPLRTWLFVAFEFASSKNGVAAREIARKYKLHGDTAWTLCHRLREAMRLGPYGALLSGTVMADEAYIGGKPWNRHQQGKTGSHVRGRKKGGPGGTPVFSLLHRESGEVRSQILSTSVPTSAVIGSVLSTNVEASTSTLWTDKAHYYMPFGRKFQSHEFVDHGHHEYVKSSGMTTNAIEGYFSQLKRSIDGTHHHVSHRYLNRYLAEFDYRYSTCDLSDGDRMEQMIRQSFGRRLAA
jgi:transposase-like protein